MKTRVVLLAVGLVVLSACSHPYHDNVLTKGTISSDGKTIQLTVANCGSHSRLRIAANTASEISLVAQDDRSSTDKCGEVGLVCLKAPLGSRKLVDAPTDTAITLTVDPALKRGATCMVTV